MKYTGKHNTKTELEKCPLHNNHPSKLSNQTIITMRT